MGNIVSFQTVHDNDDNSYHFLERIDEYIASLIISMDLESLYQLSEEKFCKEVQQLTRNIVCDQIHGIDLVTLYKRVKTGFPSIQSEPDDIEIYNEERKQEVCDDIAKFYVSIANVYAAIINILQPLLKGDQQTDICQHVLSTIANAEKNKQMMELEQLYFDKYNSETEEFDGWTELGEKMYKEDLTSFYGGFQGEDNLPPSIQKFSDISLDTIPKQYNPTTRSKDLFHQLGRHVYQTVSKSMERTEKLKLILDAIFIPMSNNKTRIQPDLTQTSLHKLIFKTRKLIVDLYANCERDQRETQKLLKLISGEKLEKTLQNQVSSIEAALKDLVA